MKQYILLAALCAAVCAQAQSLSKEITVDKDVVPQQRAAMRLNTSPVTFAPQLSPVTLQPGDRAIATSIPAMIARLEPAAKSSVDSAAAAQRGYADLGFFPSFNLAASAGYRFIQSSQTRLGAWLQYDGTSYKHQGTKWSRNAATIAAEGSHRLNASSRIDALLHYTFANHSLPWEKKSEGVNRLGLDALYSGSSANNCYTLGFEGEMVKFANHYQWLYFHPDIKPTSEIDAAINASIANSMDNNTVGLRLKAGLNHYSRFNIVELNGISSKYTPGDAKNLALVHINPFFNSRIVGGMNLELGLNADVAINSGRTFNISPQCTLSWAPTGPMGFIAMEVKATGGVRTNTLGSLLDYTPYVEPMFAHNYSRVPYHISAAVTIGPFSGAYLELSGAYAKAKGMLLPYHDWKNNLWFEQDVKGYMLRALAGYQWRDRIKASVSYAKAPSGNNKMYYQWLDRATDVVDASLTLTPIKPLDITVGFQARWGRSQTNINERMLVDADPSSQPIAPSDPSAEAYASRAADFSDGYVINSPLGAVRNLTAGALYRINTNLSVFVRGENLLNNESYLIYGIPAQGITGLVGLTYKF